jgi:hypothetical protein
MERLVQLFKEADDESAWVRVPVVNYLRACPLPEAKTHLEELAKIDPKTVDRATKFFALSPAPAPPAEGDPKTETPPKAVVPDAAAASDSPSAVVDVSASTKADADSAVDSLEPNGATSPTTVDASDKDTSAGDDDLSSEPEATGEKRNSSVTHATGPGRIPTTSTLASDSATGANSEAAGAAAKDQAAVPAAAGQGAAGHVAAGQGATGSTSPATTVQTPVVGGVWILLGSAAVGVAVFVLLLTILRGGRGRVTT